MGKVEVLVDLTFPWPCLIKISVRSFPVMLPTTHGMTRGKKIGQCNVTEAKKMRGKISKTDKMCHSEH